MTQGNHTPAPRITLSDSADTHRKTVTVVLGQAAPLRPLPQLTMSETNSVRRRDRLGGLLHEYQQVA